MPKRSELANHIFADLAVKQKRRKKSSETLADKAAYLVSSRTRAQALVAADTSRYVSVLCARRSGKSWLVLSTTLERAILRPGTDWVIAGLTRPSIKRIYWRVLLRLNEQLGIGGHPQNTELIFNLPNGSRIFFLGAESKAEIEKLRGSAYDGAVVDECKSFSPVVLRELVEDVLVPALSDRRGQLTLIGTPGDILAGPFYEATAIPPVTLPGTAVPSNRRCADRGVLLPVGGDDQALWSLHTWTLEDNTAMPHLWADALETKRRHGWSDDHPTWRREYLGEWVAGGTWLVYRYQPYVNDYEALPGQPLGIPASGVDDWRLVMGVDLGKNDPTAIVVWAYSPTSPGLWEIYSGARPGLNLREIAQWIVEVDAQYGTPEVRVIDTGGGPNSNLAVEALADDYGFDFLPAAKREKNAHIDLFNTDLDDQRIHILRGSELSAQLLTNRWNERTLGTERREEDAKTANDICDAAIYSYRYCYHKQAREVAPQVDPGTAAWWRQRRKDEMDAARERVRRAVTEDFSHRMDRDWWGMN